MSFVLGGVLGMAIGVLGALFILPARGRKTTVLNESLPTEPSQDDAADVRALASYALAAGNVTRAAYILAQDLKNTPGRRAPENWYMLLDIYHGSGNRARYDETAERAARALGHSIPPFNAFKQRFPAHAGLAKNHPQLLAELKKMPNAEAAMQFLLALTKDSLRPGRPRYTLPDAEELLKLKEQYRARLGRQESGIPSGDRQSGSGKFRTGTNPASRTPPPASAPSPGTQASKTAGSAHRRRERPGANADQEMISALEAKFPRIISKLNDLWPTRECGQFLDSLIIDDRGGREGFAPEVMEEILFLKEIIQLHHPIKRDVWDSVMR